LRIIARKALRDFWLEYPSAREPLRARYREVTSEDWDTPAKVRLRYPSSSILPGNRVVFNIKGNDFRLVVYINYPYRVVYSRFVGTHGQYDRIDAEKV
jgi:mRNA interferase HigB